MNQPLENVIIIGTGPAGLTAAIYAARASLKPLVFAGLQHGGQLTTTTDVENFPGFEHGIMGPKLMQDMTAQAERVGARIEYEEVTSVDFGTRPFKVTTSERETFAKSVIISTGATAKTLKLPHEAELMGRGLSTCATCDGFFYKDKHVAVVGGGDSAMEEATYLAKMCASVTLIHRRDEFRASPIMLERAKKDPKIQFKVPFAIETPEFDQTGVTGITLKNLETEETELLKVDGLFMAIGHTPNSGLFRNYLDTDETGYLIVNNHTQTNIPGVFAAGDIADHEFRQAITAAGMGCQAAIQAQRYLEQEED